MSEIALGVVQRPVEKGEGGGGVCLGTDRSGPMRRGGLFTEYMLIPVCAKMPKFYASVGVVPELKLLLFVGVHLRSLKRLRKKDEKGVKREEKHPLRG